MTNFPPAGASAWDAFVAEVSDASFCHLAGWRNLIHDTFGHEPVYRVETSSDGAISGVLPLFDLRSRIFGRHLVSVPFMNYGGPIGTAAARQALVAWAMDEARRRGADSLLLRSRSAVPGWLAGPASKVTVVLELPPSADEMWTRKFDAKFRNKIKRPQRDGMVTRFGGELLPDYYEVFARNMRDLGTPVLPRRFFERIVQVFPELVLVGVTYLKDRPVAAGFGFLWRGEFEMTWSSSVKDLRAAKPNMLLYWDYMRELIERGVRRFNFGRSTPGSGPHEFKRSWGARDEPLPWIRWPASPAESGEGRAATAASAVWKHLPLRVTNALGPMLARQLPWW